MNTEPCLDQKVLCSLLTKRMNTRTNGTPEPSNPLIQGLENMSLFAHPCRVQDSPSELSEQYVRNQSKNEVKAIMILFTPKKLLTLVRFFKYISVKGKTGKQKKLPYRCNFQSKPICFHLLLTSHRQHISISTNQKYLV